MNENTCVAIMAGGIGSRFWPVSRVDHPKQFIDILGTGKTLIQQTMERFRKIIPIENIYVVTAREYVGITKEQLPELPPENIIGEPFRKNTAPCIVYTAFKLLKKNPEASMIVAPADHLILEDEKFLDICNEGLEFVNNFNALVTLGIKPTYPNTGYGYIQHEDQEVAPSVYKVKTFTEKPNLELAKEIVYRKRGLPVELGNIYLESSADTGSFSPSPAGDVRAFFYGAGKFRYRKETAVIETIYPQCTNISIDFGIMEKADNVYVIPSSFGWSDLGTWNSAWENMDKDNLENALAGSNVMMVDAARCIVHAPDEKLVVVQGLNDFIVVDTKDALLICQRDKEQEIKQYVGEVKRNMGEKYL